MIRCIVETVSSARDSNGNCYHFAVFYSPSKGRHECVVIETGGPSNAVHLAYAILKDFEAILVFEHTLPKREWQRQRTYIKKILFEGTAEAKEALRHLIGEPL